MNAIKTILFVENDPVALQMYSNRLEREGFHIHSAQDGLEALKLISQMTPDLVVLDMVLRRLNGDDVLKFIRADPRLKALPVVVFSNAPVTETAQDMALAGPTRHLLKSDCTFPMLLQAIQDLLTAASDGPSIAVSSPDASSSQPHTANGQAVPADTIRDEVPKGCAQFLTEALGEIPKIREHCFAYIKAPASSASLEHLPNLHQRVHFLSTNAGKAGCARVAMLTGAFDALLSEIMVKPSWVTPSVLQTIAQAVDCLGFLLQGHGADLAQPMPPAKVLAVDDDAVCNHVIVTTLKRANFDAKSVNDPLVALQLLQNNHYDLVLLDISMPGLTGFELCEKLRHFPHGKTIPVIFITGHNNFDNRKQSVLSGGHDFITKPVSPSELVLKATLHLLKAQTRRVGAPPPATEPSADGVSKDAPPTVASPHIQQQPDSKAKNVVPAAALLPMTESGNSDAQSASSPAVAVSSGEPIPVPVAEEELQPAVPVQINRPEIRLSQSSAPPSAVQPIRESTGSDAETIPLSGEMMPRSEISVPTVLENVPGPLGSAKTNQPGTTTERKAVFPEGLLSTTESRNNDPNEKFDKIAVVVARIMFGDDSLTERNVRLVRAALEHHKVREILNGTGADAQDRSRNSRA